MRFLFLPLVCIMILVSLTGRTLVPVAAQTVYVDRCREWEGPADGTPAHPYSTLASAVAAALPRSTLIVQAGNPETSLFARLPLVIQKELTITSQGGPVQIGQPPSTQKLWQLTGEKDLERRVDTASKTLSRYWLQGTDLGASFEHNGRIYFLFGDSYSNHPSKDSSASALLDFLPPVLNPEVFTLNHDDYRPTDGDAVAWIPSGADPEQPVRLNFLTAPDGGYLSPRVLNAAGEMYARGGFQVPTSGFSANGKMYVFFTSDHFESSGWNYMGRSILGRLESERENRFSYLYDVSCLKNHCSTQNVHAGDSAGRFINISGAVVNNANIDGLRNRPGQGLLLFGTGKYRQSSPYLAYLPLDGVEKQSELRYYAGRNFSGPIWSNLESDAEPLFDQPCMGELSVSWNPFLQKWLMLYNCWNPTRPGSVIYFRTSAANQPYGPWSPPSILFDPFCDGGYCHFMQKHGCNNVSDQMFGNENVMGDPYGPYVISRFTKGDATSTTIYWVMSTWNPYQVVLMKSTLQLSCACRTS